MRHNCLELRCAMRNYIQHICNPQHIYCRLVELFGLACRVKLLKVCRVYEVLVYRLYFSWCDNSIHARHELTRIIKSVVRSEVSAYPPTFAKFADVSHATIVTAKYRELGEIEATASSMKKIAEKLQSDCLAYRAQHGDKVRKAA